MKTLWNIVLIGLAVLAIDVQAQDAMPLRMVQTVPLPNVDWQLRQGGQPTARHG